jgi:membrane-bound ClpP family serine protease
MRAPGRERANSEHAPILASMGALPRAITAVALLLGLAGLAASAAAAGEHIDRLKLIGVIDQVNAAYIEEGLAAAANGGASAVIIQIDSPGVSPDLARFITGVIKQCLSVGRPPNRAPKYDPEL